MPRQWRPPCSMAPPRAQPAYVEHRLRMVQMQSLKETTQMKWGRYGETLLSTISSRQNPHVAAVRNTLQSSWHVIDFQVFILLNDFYMFKFSSFDVSQRVLEEGPQFVDGHPLVLKRWYEKVFMHNKIQDRDHPISTRFPNLDFYCRSKSRLSKFASAIGTP